MGGGAPKASAPPPPPPPPPQPAKVQPANVKKIEKPAEQADVVSTAGKTRRKGRIASQSLISLDSFQFPSILGGG